VDGIRIAPSADIAALSKEELQELTDSLEKHINILHQHVLIDV